MDVINLLNSVETVEITTTGRTSGSPRRIEIWMYEIEGRYVITGTPGPRDWFANLRADPNMVLHLPGDVNLAAVASPVDDLEFRRRVFTADKTHWYRSQAALETLIETSPMVELQFPGLLA